jgi:ABC-type oligopeptide transport system substrate-binding subunit/class 3 adenylate cyclase
MNCPQCGTENPAGAKFCFECGARLAVACPLCGTTLPMQAKFCPECGAPQLAVPPQEAQPSAADTFGAKLQRLLPKEYAERLLATRGQVGRERRTVTILFSDVKGSTAMAEDLDPEDVMEIMDGAFEVLIEPVYRYEGTVARLMGDAVLAFFGAPIAHEDDPERAIRAALAIIQGAQEYAARLEQERGITGFDVRVGIHTGLVVVGEVGSDLRVEYTAMGDAINLASRMEQNAPPGGILITHHTYRHVRGVFDVLVQEPLAVKGKAESVQTYLVQRAKPRAFRKPVRGVEGIETRMVGREAELKHLQEAFYTAMEDSELQVVTISGEAGVGKSRLLYEFDTWSELLAEQFYYFKGRAVPEMQSMPYGLIRDLVAFRFQIRDSDPTEVVREKLEAGTGVALGSGQSSRHAAHFIGHLIGFEFGDSPHLVGVQDDAQELRDRALAHLTGYYQGLAAQAPVLILLEDLHWADDSSLDALNQLALDLGDWPVMVACAARPALFERRPHWGEGQSFHARLVLEPLSKWDSRCLVVEILQRLEDVPEALRDLVVSGAEGNPFFIEELIKMLIEDGVIVTGEGQWRLEPSRLVDVRVPPTLTGVLQARLDRLPLAERTVLQQASVVGRLFWDRAVARINESAGEGIEESEVVGRLSALRGREMVFQRETSAFADAQEYLFKHALLREVTYESVLKRVRRAYHGMVADWLLEQGGERVEEYTGLIADHLELAGRTEEALEYLLQAGDRARRLYAHREAIQAYERALALLKEEGDEERAARTLMKLGLAYHNAFQFQRSRQAYDEGFALWRRAGEVQAAVGHAPHALRLFWYDLPTLDWALHEGTENSAQLDHLFSGLVALTPELDLVPDVARSWEVLDGGRKYLFHLRDDVRWSDGVPVTAGDFEYAWRRLLKTSTSQGIVAMLDAVAAAKAFHRGDVAEPTSLGVRALEDLTLLVELEGPTGHFLQLLTEYTAFPVPRHVVEAHGEAWVQEENIVTNGPFRLEAWKPGESMELVRYADYHGPFTGNVERIELCLLPLAEWPEILQRYQDDRLDVLPRLWFLPPQQRDRTQQRYAGEAVSIPALHTGAVWFDGRRPPFSDVSVRRAFVLAADRRALLDATWPGWTPATGGFIPPSMPGHSPGIALPYDPQKARQLLADAGYPGGRGFPTLRALTWHGGEPTLEYLQDQWRENLGVEMRWDAVPFGKSLWAESQENQAQIKGGAWQADYPDPNDFLQLGAQRWFTGWRSETYDRLVEEARRSMDQAERMKLFRRADRILVEEAVLMPYGHARWTLLVKPWVKRYPTSPMRQWFWKDVVIEPH